MIRRPPRSTLSSSSAASDVYKRPLLECRTVGRSVARAADAGPPYARAADAGPPYADVEHTSVSRELIRTWAQHRRWCGGARQVAACAPPPVQTQHRGVVAQLVVLVVAGRPDDVPHGLGGGQGGGGEQGTLQPLLAVLLANRVGRLDQAVADQHQPVAGGRRALDVLAAFEHPQRHVWAARPEP